ncbi:thiopurine S-methyltransferase [Vibrio sp. SM6]|uniref:Thiopurine S-methyltransferase n=1 Tax=Vibrio agarilyticus TaxID=2726741 RepID=A0A7X8TQU5_9VIBR|nr:thiopurine S-methyltransferase [Vibrio agarilyticus]NLS12946.1 thiopurine S-methyltransferase [Vibrio agarilyticus]
MQEQEFWHQKWASNQIGFHLLDVNPLLSQYWGATQPERHHSVLVPLCGKSEDLVWLAARHDNVIGVELCPIAVRAFFAEHFYTPTVTELSGSHQLYQFDELSIYSGDFFTAPLSKADRIYDRAALSALSPSQREAYVRRLLEHLNPGGKILLVTLDYAQEEMSGPPYSVPFTEISQRFEQCKITQLFVDDADEAHPKRVQKGLSRFSEQVYLIET